MYLGLLLVGGSLRWYTEQNGCSALSGRARWRRRIYAYDRGSPLAFGLRSPAGGSDGVSVAPVLSVLVLR